MYEVVIFLKPSISFPLKKLLRENNFSKYTFNNITREYNATGKREVIPINFDHCGIQHIYVYNGDVLPPAIHKIFKRLEEEDKQAVVDYSFKYTTL